MSYITNSKEFPGVNAEDGFPKPSTVVVGLKDSNYFVEVAPTAAQTAPPKPINSFTDSKVNIWIFGANTMAANLKALAGLSKYLQKEVQVPDRPKWAKNIEELVVALDEAVKKSDQLCSDTEKTLPGKPAA